MVDEQHQFFNSMHVVFERTSEINVMQKKISCHALYDLQLRVKFFPVDIFTKSTQVDLNIHYFDINRLYNMESLHLTSSAAMLVYR